MGAGTRIITASYRGDIDQFSLLRRSLELFAPQQEQLAVVHSEDYAVFQDRFGSDARLQLVKTSDVLPRRLQRRRVKGHRKLFKSLHKRLLGADVSGWHAQQLSKIYALAGCDCSEAAFIDSDVVLCQPLAEDFFRLHGRTKLFRRAPPNAELLDFDISTHVILGNPLHQVHALYDYIFQPASFRPSSAKVLLAKLQASHGEAWIDRFVRERRPSEYNLLGHAATVLEDGRDYILVECDPQDLHHSIRFDDDVKRLPAEAEHCLQAAKPLLPGAIEAPAIFRQRKAGVRAGHAGRAGPPGSQT
jgi:hypothetical protein